MAHPAAGAVQGNGLVDDGTKREMTGLTNRALDDLLSSDRKGNGVIFCRYVDATVLQRAQNEGSLHVRVEVSA